MRVSDPDRVYTVTLQSEGDIECTINTIFWDQVVKIYDILLAEQDWPPDFVRDCIVGEEVIIPSFSPLVPGELAESYSIKGALAQAPALYRNHVGWDRDSPYHVIPIKGEPQPQPQYPIKFEARASVRNILTQLEYQGVLEPCVSPMNNPLFPVAKPDHSYRIVVDYRHLNGHARTFAIQNSHSAALMNNIVRKKYKTTLDISNGFFCQNLEPKSRDFTSFSAFGSQKKNCRLPQGYKNSPGLFSARVTEILHELDPEALSYVDDMYLTDDELLQHLRRVARIVVGFAEIGYKFNFKKLKIAFLSVIFLGYELSNEEQRFVQTEKILTAVQMAVIKERPLAQGQRIIVVSPIPALEAVTKASVPNAKDLHPRWIQWATSFTATEIDYIFDPKLQTQEFLQYEMEYAVPAGTLPIDQYQVVMYTDGSAQPASFNEYLHYWRLNGFRDSKGNTIKHRLLWGKVADLKETLPNDHVVHTLGHQRVGIHVAGNTLADEAVKSAVAVATVAAVTRLSSKPDTEILAAIKATADGTPYPKGFPSKYHYSMGGMLNAEVKIPGIGIREMPNKVVRPQLITAAHEGAASAHAGVAATISLLQARYWWPGLYKETKQYVLCCDICQQIKVSTAKRLQQMPLLISNKPLQCVYLDHCGPLTPDSAYKYIMVAVDSCSRFVWVWPQRSADARTVIKDLRIFVGTYAVAAFHSDQGPVFASKAFRDAMASLGV
ncbi:hypothetical protein NDU88_005234 [Pleurodeles waltl]|uniref:Gypsy retrotransposon integrase-like protein 1 n=1 Tax=Pleurodeles waltl TaxID=8319 RepID=A0AAV7VIG0_PLEWA|nr:hypothetical protein NDU88_005234 [Pleurodeles waltl]